MKRKVIAIVVAVTIFGLASHLKFQQPNPQGRKIAGLTAKSFLDKGKQNLSWPSGKDFLAKFNALEDDHEKIALFFEWSKAVPNSLYAELREKAPLLVGPALELEGFAEGLLGYTKIKQTMFVTKRKDVIDILENSKFSAINRGKFKKEKSDADALSTLLPQPEDMEKLRLKVAQMTKDAINDGTYISQYPNKETFGRLELVSQIGREVPYSFLTEHYAVSYARKKALIEASRALQEYYLFPHLATASIRERADESREIINEYFTNGISKSQKGANSIVGKIFQGNKEKMHKLVEYYDPLIGSNILATMLGAVESTQAGVTSALEVILNRPSVYAKAKAAADAENHDEFAKIVWEALRLNPVNPILVRIATEDVTLSDKKTIIPKDTLLFVSTHSAMMDDDPTTFRTDRSDDYYLHFKYDHPFYSAGDRLTEMLVPTIVEEVMKLKGIRRALGYYGELSRMGMGQAHEIRSFPEHFAVEYDADPAPAGKWQIADKNYPFEELLMDFDRNDYRNCLSGEYQYGSIPENTIKHFYSTTAKGLLFCRLKKEFRDCIRKNWAADILDKDANHSQMMYKCTNGIGKPDLLTNLEKYFYVSVFSETTEPRSPRYKPTGQEKRPVAKRISEARQTNDDKWQGGWNGGGWEYEDYLKFFNHYSYRDCHFNPIGVWHMKDNYKFEFYSRMNEPFRLYCFGPTEVQNIGEKLKKDLSGYLKTGETSVTLPSDAEMVEMHKATFAQCHKGKYDPDEGRIQGQLSPIEEWYFHKVMMEEKVGPLENVQFKWVAPEKDPEIR